jgi:hemolysin activation/secretion protein
MTTKPARSFSTRFVGQCKPTLIAALCASAVSGVWSQTLPAAGQIEQPLAPTQGVSPVTRTEVSSAQAAPGSSASVLVSGFTFTGNSAISSEELTQLVQSSLNQKLDLAGLDQVTDRVSRHYRSKGFAVARAYLPPQESADGTIRIAIIEGQFDQVKIKNTSSVNTDRLSKMVAANLCDDNGTDATGCKGSLVEDAGLERTVLLLKDLPGTTAAANIKPGSAVGTTDFEVEVKTLRSALYSVGLDNYGSTATGKIRLNAGADFYNLSNNGDTLSLGFASTVKQGSNTGSIAYSLPAGYSGARMGVALARSQYRLGAGFDATKSHGTSNTLSWFGSYPVLRSVNRSFYIRGSAEVRGMYDSVDLTKNYFRKNATVLRAGFNGDNVDSFGGGGYTVYGATVTNGLLNTNDVADATTAKTAGRFNKLAYNIARQQALSGPITLYGSVNGQLAGSRNLDGSEQIGIGGPGAVRGYAGEAGGSQGLVGSLELRHTQPFKLGESNSSYNVTSAVFVDRGWVNLYKDTSRVTASKRALGGYGVSLTLQSSNLYVRAVYAGHRASQPSQVTPTENTNFWLQAGYSY